MLRCKLLRCKLLRCRLLGSELLRSELLRSELPGVLELRRFIAAGRFTVIGNCRWWLRRLQAGVRSPLDLLGCCRAGLLNNYCLPGSGIDLLHRPKDGRRNVVVIGLIIVSQDSA